MEMNAIKLRKGGNNKNNVDKFGGDKGSNANGTHLGGSLDVYRTSHSSQVTSTTRVSVTQCLFIYLPNALEMSKKSN